MNFDPDIQSDLAALVAFQRYGTIPELLKCCLSEFSSDDLSSAVSHWLHWLENRALLRDFLGQLNQRTFPEDKAVIECLPGLKRLLTIREGKMAYLPNVDLSIQHQLEQYVKDQLDQFEIWKT